MEQDPKSKAALEADTTDRTEIPHITIETAANIDVAEVVRGVYANHKRRLERCASTVGVAVSIFVQVTNFLNIDTFMLISKP